MLTQGYIVLAELNLLSSNHPAGVYVLPNPGNPLDWQGLVSIRSGYFHGGIFPFKLQLPKDFPSKIVPRVYLPKGFYHPYVNPETGELSIKSLLVQWNPEKHHIWHVLHHMRNLLTSPTSCILEHSAEQLQFLSRSSIYTDSSPPPPSAMANTTTNTGGSCVGPNDECSNYPNPEAVDLIVNHRAEFEAKAKQCVETLSIWSQTCQATSNWDPFLVDINGWMDESFLQHAREAVRSKNVSSQPDICTPPGYSWIDPKTMAVFSSEASTPKTTLDV